jgi:hypothetical protein
MTAKVQIPPQNRGSLPPHMVKCDGEKAVFFKKKSGRPGCPRGRGGLPFGC